MNNFFELEKRYKKYRFKQIFGILKYVLLALVIIVLLIVAYLYFNKESAHTKIEKSKSKPIISKPIKQKILPTHKVIKDKNISKPESTKKLKTEKIPTFKAIINLDMIDFKKEDHKIKQKNQTKNIKLVKTKKEESARVIISTKVVPSFETSFKLMNLYFKDEDYIKSKEWAIKASKIKPQNEDVWRIYALSLYKLNKKNEAIKVLKIYLKYKQSIKIEKTLESIEKGNL